ncbi:ubiquitin fusion degradation protein UFD1 [Nitzschia inconspicua]|uniref:Ubiquitin fusion degradation protein UFD1 n=1 Tax=Nitzschia inconspicua TaxID=303405 RepID=A0A9K3Q665_9STRA|nr:ubiquitin fusion degradation protein UFD1 [Nitzschia inconspicua]
MPSRVYYFLLLTCITLSRAHATSGSKPSIPISLQQSGIGKAFYNRIDRANELAALEQQVEDHNALLVATANTRLEANSRRRLICLPLNEKFNPPMGQFSHNHVQNGDKLSVPRNFAEAFREGGFEVPFLLKVSRVEGVTKPMVEDDRIDNDTTPSRPLEEVVGGPLDFRAPSNYCFLPLWMMRAMRLHPRDIVDVKVTTTVPAGTMAKFRPHSSDFNKDISNPRAVLETELRHYSALTRGSTIAFDYNGKRYWVDVEELRMEPRGEKAPMVKVQDCDLATDFLMPKDEQKRRKEERKRRLEEQKGNQE